jgi:hypothetical protein
MAGIIDYDLKVGDELTDRGSASYTDSTFQEITVANAATDMPLDFGGVTTAYVFYLISDQPITVYFAASGTAISILANKPFFQAGTAITAIYLTNQSGSAANVKWQIWGDSGASTTPSVSTLGTALANTSNATYGDALIGYKNVSTGGQARTVHDRFMDFAVSALDFMTAAQIADVRAGTGAVDVTAAVLAADTAAGASGVTYIPAGTYLIDDLTLVSHVVCHGKFSINSGEVLTISSSFEAGDYQVFSGSGTVVFTYGSVLNGRWWGAIGDDSTDNTAALQAWINAVEAGNGRSGYLPKGTYQHTGLAITSVVILYGDGGLGNAPGFTNGGTILNNIHISNNSLTIDGTLIVNLLIRDMTFTADSSVTGHTGNGIVINAQGEMTLRNVTVIGHGGDGMQLSTTYHTNGVNIDDCYIAYNKGNGIYGRTEAAKQLNAITIQNSQIYANELVTGGGINIWGNVVNIKHNTIQYNLGAGIMLSGEDMATVNSSAMKINVKDNYFEGDAGGEILAECSHDVPTSRTHSLQYLVIEDNSFSLLAAQVNVGVTAIVTFRYNTDYAYYAGFFPAYLGKNRYYTNTLYYAEFNTTATYLVTVQVDLADGTVIGTYFHGLSASTTIEEIRIRSGVGQPTIVPDYRGQRYLDTTNQRFWMAFQSGSADYFRPISDGIIMTMADSATPSVLSGRNFVTGGTTTITNFTNGYIGKTITILADHSVTITDGTNIFLAGSANFAMAASDSLTLIEKADGKWYEISRSDN